MSRDRARFQTTLARAVVETTQRDKHDHHALVIRIVEHLATCGAPLHGPLTIESVVAATLWLAAEDPDVLEAVRNMAALFALELPAAELERAAKAGA